LPLGGDSCDIAEGDLKMDEQNSEKSDSSDVKPKIHILAPNVPQNQLLSNYLTQCTGYPATCGAQSCSSFDNTESKDLCSLLLIDCYNLEEPRIWSTVELDNRYGKNPTSIAFFNLSNELPEKFEEAAIDRGVRGIFYEGDSLDMLIQGVQAILKGEFWYSRKAMSQYVEAKLAQHSTPQDEVPPMTHRQKEILQLLIAGKTIEEIAAKLCISLSTVKSHLDSLFKKINVPSRLQAVFWASKFLP
jgi:LuxR family transcriptional regulator, positive regulator of biofilm formation